MKPPLCLRSVAIPQDMPAMKEKNMLYSQERYDFEDLLDELGFCYGEKLVLQPSKNNLWKIEFH